MHPAGLVDRAQRGRHRPWGQQRIALTSTTQIDREDLGITFNAPMEGGGYLIGKPVKIEIELEAVRQTS